MKKNLDIVITMARLGTRFKKAGYPEPKYMINVKGHTLFEWSMFSLKGYSPIVSHYIFIVRKENDVRQFIDSQCKKLGIGEYHIIELDYLTDGQATTAMLANGIWNQEHRLLIYNIDTYVEAGELHYNQLRGCGFIPCFNGQGDHWSFVRIGANEKALEVREKCRISSHCTLGAYYFETCRIYEELYHRYYKNNTDLEKGEKYIAPMYNDLIERGKDVYICNIDRRKVHVLGTPEELDIFREAIGENG